VSYRGLANGDTAIESPPTAGDRAGNQPRRQLSDYGRGRVGPGLHIAYAPGTLTISPAPLTITVDDHQMVYGGALPALTF